MTGGNSMPLDELNKQADEGLKIVPMNRGAFGRAYLNLVGKDSHIGKELTGQEADELYKDYAKSGKTFEDWALEQMPDKVFTELHVEITSLMSTEDGEYLEDALAEVLQGMGLKGRVKNPWGNDLQIENEERCLEMNTNKYLQKIGFLTRVEAERDADLADRGKEEGKEARARGEE
jgi:hypothetical protein